MAHVVIVANQRTHGEQVAKALAGTQGLEVAGIATGHRLADGLARIPPDVLAGAGVVVFVPAEPVERPPADSEGVEHQPPVVVYDVEGRVSVMTAMGIGARGYVDFEEPEALVERVRRVADGGWAWPPDTEANIREALRIVLRADPAIRSLTEEEITIMRLMSMDWTRERIARRLGCGTSTLYRHLERIRKKLKVKTDFDAMVRLYHAGLVRFDDEPES